MTKKNGFYLELADVIAKRSSCVRRKFGSVLVKDKAIISAGYNGSPFGFPNCEDGGCPRCNDPNVKPYEGYDQCICVHSEENTILLAARHGTKTNGATLYTQSRPCFGCLKALIQAGIVAVYYKNEDWYSEPQQRKLYNSLVKLTGIEIRKVKTSD